jgi:hypothetical protein
MFTPRAESSFSAPTGEIFDLARNMPSDSECASATFGADGKTLFLNV